MTFGERLREERERLGLSQPKLAAVAGTTKQTLFSWESGKTAPDGFQLGLLTTAGIDVLYIITGQRLSPEHRAMFDVMRQASEDDAHLVGQAAEVVTKQAEVDAHLDEWITSELRPLLRGIPDEARETIRQVAVLARKVGW